jgi:hypothetical protein
MTGEHGTIAAMSVEPRNMRLIDLASPNVDPDVPRWFLSLTPDQRMHQLEQLWPLLGLIRRPARQETDHAEHPEENG